MMLSGSHRTGATLELEGDYGGGWRWRVTVDATDAENLWVQMDNVIPAEHATARSPPAVSRDGYACRTRLTERAFVITAVKRCRTRTFRITIVNTCAAVARKPCRFPAQPSRRTQ